jgi:hypothetical protein
MKRLEIKNFTKACMDLYSDYFDIKYCTDTGDTYVISIDTNDVVSFKPLHKNHYKLAIHKEEGDSEDYHMWLWDMNKNISYPMNIYKRNLESTTEFTVFLNHILRMANEGIFDGTPGNRVTIK